MKTKAKIFLFLFSFLFLCTASFSVYAKEVEKNITVTLSENYIQCGFYITFENGNIIEDTVVISPSKEEYPASIDPVSGILKATIKNAKAGTYQVRIRKQISGETENPIDKEIGQVTVNVKAEAETKDVVNGDLKLTKEIYGLRIYWKDDSIVADWEDDSVGKVNITIVDAKTLQILDHQTVKENYYEFPISATVEEILITVIPTVSEGVPGAGEEYSIPFINQPSGTITFEDFEYTNKEFIQATVVLNSPYRLIYENNGTYVGESEDILPAGTHQIEVPTVIGDNLIKIYIVDDKHNMRSTSHFFVCDVTPPVLKIENDINGISTLENTVTISGMVTDFSTLYFRNESIDVEWDGTFSVEAFLKEGENDLLLTASDEAGNEVVYRAVVTKLIPKKSAFPWPNVGIGTGFLLLFILFIIKRKVFATLHITIPSPKKTKNNSPEKVKRVKVDSPFSKRTITDYICFLITILIYFILIFFVFQFGIVQSSSMEPNLMKQEWIVGNKLAYLVKKPQRGDIVTFSFPDSKEILVKRIIGLPGDKIEFVDGYIFINGIICDESAYLKEDIETNSNTSFQVPADSYFLLGDNRSNSYDSRYWSIPYVKKEQLQAKLLFHLNLF